MMQKNPRGEAAKGPSYILPGKLSKRAKKNITALTR